MPQLLDEPWWYCDTYVQVTLTLCWITMPASFTLFHHKGILSSHQRKVSTVQYDILREHERKSSIQLLVTTVYYYNCSISLSSIILFLWPIYQWHTCIEKNRVHTGYGSARSCRHPLGTYSS